MINESSNLLNIMNTFSTITTTDFNGDNIVNEADFIALVNVLNQTYLEEDISIFDLNNDGIIDLFDVMMIIQSQRVTAA
jgi:predicted membrane protein